MTDSKPKAECVPFFARHVLREVSQRIAHVDGNKKYSTAEHYGRALESFRTTAHHENPDPQVLLRRLNGQLNSILQHKKESWTRGAMPEFGFEQDILLQDQVLDAFDMFGDTYIDIIRDEVCQVSGDEDNGPLLNESAETNRAIRARYEAVKSKLVIAANLWYYSVRVTLPLLSEMKDVEATVAKVREERKAVEQRRIAAERRARERRETTSRRETPASGPSREVLESREKGAYVLYLSKGNKASESMYSIMLDSMGDIRSIRMYVQSQVISDLGSKRKGRSYNQLCREHGLGNNCRPNRLIKKIK